MPPLSIQQAIDLAKRAHQAGDLPQAQGIYRQVLEASPGHPEALHLLGLVELQSGRFEQARELIERAIALAPAAPHFHANLGLALVSIGRFDEAIVAYERALKLHPEFPQARSGLGDAHARRGQWLHDQGRIDDAIAAYRAALSYRPDQVELHNNIAAGYMQTGRSAQAIEILQQALHLRKDYREAQMNLGIALRDLGRIDEAMEAFEAVTGQFPEWFVPRCSLGMLKLLKGEFHEGWPLLEWRWEEPELANFRNSYTRPPWRGEPLEGKRIILHAEQGFGDAIQFIRYVPRVIERGGRVIVACQPELLRLFQESINGVEQWITPGSKIPHYDLHCSLMSLPMVFGTRLETIPRDVPYLYPSPEGSATWSQRVMALGPGRKIGLAWAGRPTHRQDRSRSIKPELLAPLGTVQGVQWINFQIGRGGVDQLGFPITDFTPALTDFAETARLIDPLDLVITVDTALAHLAGAMGKPVWVLLPKVPDWRWMLDRSDSPWYPTMRLFRQPEPGDWAAVIQGVVDALR